MTPPKKGDFRVNLDRHGQFHSLPFASPQEASFRISEHLEHPARPQPPRSPAAPYSPQNWRGKYPLRTS